MQATNLSYGEGTLIPFGIIGAPWIGGDALINILDEQEFSGINFDPIDFTPVQIPGGPDNIIYKDEKCSGVIFTIPDRNVFSPVDVGGFIIGTIAKLYPYRYKLNNPEFFDQCYGGRNFRMDINLGKDIKDIQSRWQADLTKYQKLIKKYMLY